MIKMAILKEYSVNYINKVNQIVLK